MKKYLLTGLLTFVGLFGAFTSANTVGNFSSDSDICAINFSNEGDFSPAYYDICGEDIAWYEGNMYGYIETDGVPFYLFNGFNCGGSDTFLVSSVPYSVSICMEDTSFSFLSEYDNFQSKISKSGTLYVSKNPITYTPPSSGGGNSGGSSEGILSGGITTLTPVLTGIQTVIGEFIPYMVYMALGILIVSLGFIAVKWLVNYVGSKVYSLFSSKRRK